MEEDVGRHGDHFVQRTRSVFVAFRFDLSLGGKGDISWSAKDTDVAVSLDGELSMRSAYYLRRGQL